MSYGTETKITLAKVQSYYEAISLIEDEDLRPNSQGEVKLNITSKLSAKTIYKLGRFKEELTSAYKRIKKMERDLRDNHVAVRDEKTNKILKIDLISYTSELEKNLEDEALVETVHIPTLYLKEFMEGDSKNQKFVVPMRFISALSSIIITEEER